MDFQPSYTRFHDIFNRNSKPDRKPIFGDQLIETPKPEGNDLGQLLKDSYGESSKATEMFNEYLASQPNESDYNPSKKRRLAAALIGGAMALSDPSAGAKLGNEIRDEPFNKANRNWAAKGKPLALAAESEQKSRETKRNFLRDMTNLEHTRALENLSQENVRADNERGERTLAETVAQHEAERSRWEADRNRMAAENLELQKDRDANRARQEAADKENANYHKGMLGVAQTNANTAKTRANTYQSSVESSNAYREHLKSKLANFKGDTASQQKIADDLATHDVVLDGANSQIYGNFIDRDDKGRIVVKPPSMGMFTSEDEFNSELAEYAKFRKLIDTKRNEILSKNRPALTPPTKTPVLRRREKE